MRVIAWRETYFSLPDLIPLVSSM